MDGPAGMRGQRNQIQTYRVPAETPSLARKEIHSHLKERKTSGLADVRRDTRRWWIGTRAVPGSGIIPVKVKLIPCNQSIDPSLINCLHLGSQHPSRTSFTLRIPFFWWKPVRFPSVEPGNCQLLLPCAHLQYFSYIFLRWVFIILQSRLNVFTYFAS